MAEVTLTYIVENGIPRVRATIDAEFKPHEFIGRADSVVALFKLDEMRYALADAANKEFASLSAAARLHLKGGAR